MPSDVITIRGAREHNLQGLNLTLPKHRLLVFTGLSGSGKSSLAFDTLYAEGQRLYVESLSPYARQFMPQLPRPRLDAVEGLCPAIAIQQGVASHNPRSTVGTITEIYDYLRVLYATLGEPHCPECGRPLGAQSRQSILDQIRTLNQNGSLQILAPLVSGRRGQFKDLFADLHRRGFAHARVDGEPIRLENPPLLDRYRRHDVELVIDRLPARTQEPGRLAETVDTALEWGEGNLLVLPLSGEEIRFSRDSSCPECLISLPEMYPASFSFNNPRGMCHTCEGLGVCKRLDPALLVEHPQKSLRQGALPTLNKLIRRIEWHWLEGVGNHFGFSLDTPWQDLTPEQRQVLLQGTPERIRYLFRNPRTGWEWRHAGPWEGLLQWFMHRYKRTAGGPWRMMLDKVIRESPCPDCGGQRLCRESLAVKLGGKSIAELLAMTVTEAQVFFETLELTGARGQIAEEPLKELRQRLRFLQHVGLHYLTLDRTAPTLSGGEAQRLRLAGQIGSGLTDCLYVLDEPSIGLHHRDQARLIEALQALRDQDNTILVVEHDEQTVLSADWVVDFGPGAGERGGQIVAQGTPAQIRRSRSLTGKYLSGRRSLPVPEQRRNGNGKRLVLSGARANNLRDLTVEFPLGTYICVTGVSGSGKSSLVTDTLFPALAQRLNRAQTPPGPFDNLTGAEHLDKAVLIDQSPIGRTPRSNPATYTGVFTHIRELFTKVPEARARGYKPGRFSFNVAEGRCPECEGHGAVRLEADFLAEVWVPCEKCRGLRFDRETLEITYRGANIAEVLEMEITEAREHFSAHPTLTRILQTLIDVGLGYIKLGQPATTLSGGEAQRVKLARELARPRAARSLYLLDEPTVGLHFEDVRRLLEVLQRFVEEGHTVLVIEHHPDLIKAADYLIDLGPEGGEEGGRIVATGTPEELAACPTSHTGALLREVLGGGHRVPAVGKRRRSSRSRTTALAVRGARRHNLQNLTVSLPRRQLVALAGLSGSGKTSLALDTIYAEGQRRFVGSLSPYARQFINQMPKPPVESLTGLSPAVAVESRNAIVTPRSTVGTVTQIYDYLRVLYARVGQQHCPDCQVPLGAASVDEVVDRLTTAYRGRPLILLAPLRPTGSEEYQGRLALAEREGWTRVWVDGEQRRLPLPFAPDRRRHHEVAVIVDRLTPDPRERSRLAEGVEAAFHLTEGQLEARLAEDPLAEPLFFGADLSCPRCGTAYDRLSPRQYSFNHYEGWCDRCYGLGTLGGGWSREEAHTCPDCQGDRLYPASAATLFRDLSLPALSRLPLGESLRFFQGLQLTPAEIARTKDVFGEITRRLGLLMEIGLDYLTLDRSGPTLSGGELQRVNLAGQLGCGLTGLLYVLDEPTVGVHPRDNDLMLAALRRLQSLGNSLLVVEHDLQTLRSADHLVEFGPGAGVAGGRVVAQGTPASVSQGSTLTGQYLSGRLAVPLPADRRPPFRDHLGELTLTRVNRHNLRNLTIRLPLGRLVCITGPSGSGKSTLVNEVLYPLLVGASFSNRSEAIDARSLGPAQRAGGNSSTDALKASPTGNASSATLTGAEHLCQVVSLDQSPIGQSPRSNPATYVGAFDLLRQFYARLPESRRRGYQPGKFSFNRAGGRCEACEGLGVRRVEMHFLPDVWVTCDVCEGRRYQPEVLEIRHQGKNIADMLELTVVEARDRFANFPALYRILETMCQVGLDYLPLGQAAPTLSGGEAQRVKLARELVKPLGPRCLYLLDEPTTGLHSEDVRRLLLILHTLVEQGNSMIIIEHNLEVIKNADYVLDLGPGGGDRGGKIVARGTPERVARNRRSATAPYLAAALATSPAVPRSALLADLPRRSHG